MRIVFEFVTWLIPTLSFVGFVLAEGFVINWLYKVYTHFTG